MSTESILLNSPWSGSLLLGFVFKLLLGSSELSPVLHSYHALVKTSVMIEVSEFTTVMFVQRAQKG